MEKCTFCQLGRGDTKIGQDITNSCATSRNGPCSACRKLLNIDARIDEARRTLGALLDERERLSSAINKHHDPFQARLPVEITSRIFLHCRPFLPSLHIFNPSFDEEEYIESILNLTHVNQNWRNVAHNTPELWTIFGTTITPSNCISTISIADQWIERSGGLPLFIQLRSDDPENEPMNEVVSRSVHRVIASVTRRAPRLKVLCLKLPSEMVSFLSSSLSIQRLDLLEHLRVYLDFTVAGDTTGTLSLKTSPRILTLDHGWLHQVSVNLSQLTEFTATSSLDLLECIPLFKDLPNLLFCRIVDVLPPSGSLLGIPVNHTSLQTLILGRCTPEFWDCFGFPSLQILRILDARGARGWSGIKDLVCRSKCSISQMSIFVDAVEGGEPIMDILNVTPDLEWLEISGSVWGGSLLSLMDSSAVDTAGFLHKLRSLKCRGPFFRSPFHWPSFVVFLMTMSLRQERSLQHIQVVYWDEAADLDDWHDSVMDQNTFKHVMDILQGLKYKVTDSVGLDLIDSLCRYHEI